MLLLLMVTLELATHTITWTDVTTIYVYAPVTVTLELGQEECVRALVWESV